MFGNLKKIKDKLLNRYGCINEREFTYEEFENISHYYNWKKQNDNNSSYVDDITWHDVDMDDIFLQVNNTNSSLGQEYLYYLLRKADVTTEELIERDRLSDYFDTNENERLNISALFYKMGYARKISIIDYINNLLKAPVTNTLVHYVKLIFLIASLVYMLCVDASGGLLMFVVMGTIQIITYYKEKAKVEAYFSCVKYVVEMSKCAKGIIRCNYGPLSSYNERLKRINATIEPLLKGCAILSDSRKVDGSLAELILDYVRILTHLDIVKFNSIVKKLGAHTDEIYELYEILGYIESMIAIASYRRFLPYYSKPEFEDGKTVLCIEDAYHPLISEPVTNSIITDKCVLITGSNASGKSTFLKMIAINAILSQTIFTSVSKKYKASQFNIYSSIALSDNLSGGESYYIVEIKSLKRILEAINDDKPTLCFVDEVLRGTNTVERIAASSQILNSLSNNNAICFAATHDIELTRILADSYDNYHFREEVIENDIKFNYHIYNGPATTRNAIKLLGIIGYDDEIIKASEKMAADFVESGEWKKMEV